MRCWVFLAEVAATLLAVRARDPFAESCRIHEYPPAGPTYKGTIPEYVINLDLPPSERWVQVVRDKKNELKVVMKIIRDIVLTFIPNEKFVASMESKIGWLCSTLPYPFNEEIKGIASAIDAPLGDVVVFNIFYEIFTGMFTLTMNERFSLDGGYIGVFEWLIGKRDGWWMSFLTRAVLENSTSYEDAKDKLANTKLLAPAYFILGGNKLDEGCIITRSRTAALNIKNLDTKNGNWFVVETNYDPWKLPLVIDDRRHPAMNCLNQTGQELTVSTTLLEVSEGHIETYLRDCPDPCSPW
ncbi:hypothetical protein Chor_000981 [Crotalus horridus]